MEWIATIQKAIAYIEEHLLEDINYEDIAKHLNTSSYEFHRTFSFLTGMTVGTYIRNRRLSLAGFDIINTTDKIIDIALKYGYETPESFTKAFTRFHGVSPKIARDDSAKLVLFNPFVIKLTFFSGSMPESLIITGSNLLGNKSEIAFLNCLLILASKSRNTRVSSCSTVRAGFKSIVIGNSSP